MYREALAPDRPDGLYATLENALAEARAAVRYAKNQGSFTSPKLLEAFEAEVTRLEQEKEKVDFLLVRGTMPGTSWGAAPFRMPRNKPRKRGKTVGEHTGALVFGERPGVDQVTTKPITESELLRRIETLREVAKFRNPASFDDPEMVLVERPKKIWNVRRQSTPNTTPLEVEGYTMRSSQESEPIHEEEYPAESPAPPEESEEIDSGETLQGTFERTQEAFRVAATRFTYEPGTIPYTNYAEARAELLKAFDAYLQALWELNPEAYPDIDTQIGAMHELQVRRQYHEAYAPLGPNQGTADTYRPNPARAARLEEEGAIRHVKRQKKKRGLFTNAFATLLLALGIGGVKYGVDQYSSAPVQTERSGADIPTGRSLSELLALEPEEQVSDESRSRPPLDEDLLMQLEPAAYENLTPEELSIRNQRLGGDPQADSQ